LYQLLVIFFCILPVYEIVDEDSLSV
jgi:hypothetical protein